MAAILRRLAKHRAARVSQSARPRPPLLKALGRSEPPHEVVVDGTAFHRLAVFKHDSWAATALYAAEDDSRIVCKFNRVQPILGLPTRWLGRALAQRERRMLEHLAAEPLVPLSCGDVQVAGRTLPNCVAHVFVPGRPLVRRQALPPDFFRQLSALIERVHRAGIAYVDLHKRENILVGDDGLPYLIDFQISVQLPGRSIAGLVLRMLQRCDRYHLTKHVRRAEIDAGRCQRRLRGSDRPWIIRLHRRIAAPLRTLRRQWLVWTGVRTAGGRAHSETMPEVGVLAGTMS